MNTLKKIKQVLQSEFLMPFIFAFAFIMWFFNLNEILLCSMCIIVAVILCFCDDIKNIYGIILYAGFYIKDIVAFANWKLYILCVAFVVIAFIIFTVELFIEKKGKLKLGRLFFPLIVFDVGFLLGGINCNFKLLHTAIIFALALVMLLLYFSAVNSTENLSRYFAYLFVFGAIFVYLGMLCANIQNTHQLDYTAFQVAAWNKAWCSAEGPNTSAIFVGLGMCGIMYLGFQKKWDYIALVIALIFAVFVFTISCRGMILTSILTIIPMTVYSFIKSKNKMKYLIVFAVAGISIVLLYFFFKPLNFAVSNAINKFNVGKSSGRLGEGGLWQWCLNKFKTYPIFGYGFISKETVPTIRGQTQYYILAHDTLLQWFTSIGIVGVILSGWFYFRKYKLLLTRLFGATFFIVMAVVVIVLSGVTEQAAAMDPFVFLYPIIMMASLEKEPPSFTLKRLFKKNKKRENV